MKKKKNKFSDKKRKKSRKKRNKKERIISWIYSSQFTLPNLGIYACWVKPKMVCVNPARKNNGYQADTYPAIILSGSGVFCIL